MRHMNIKAYGGIDEIGGNKIVFEHKGTKILLDIGMSFGQVGEYFDEFMQPRQGVGLTDFFELGLLPDIKGLYREDILKHMGITIVDADDLIEQLKLTFRL